MTEAQQVYISTLCPKTRRSAIITLETTQKQIKTTVEGRPIDCNHLNDCKSAKTPRCYLNALHVKGLRK